RGAAEALDRELRAARAPLVPEGLAHHQRGGVRRRREPVARLRARREEDLEAAVGTNLELVERPVGDGATAALAAERAAIDRGAHQVRVAAPARDAVVVRAADVRVRVMVVG